MPLPVTDIAWPPKPLETVTPKLNEWNAWWSGDVGKLESIYRTTTAVRPSQQQGGVVGALGRFWWGRPQQDLTQQREKVHVPLPADIARTSADLLFARPPEIRLSNKPTAAWVAENLSDDLFDTLTGAAERGAALGGVYLRVVVDPTVSDVAFVTAVPATRAWPEMAWDKLRAVTFWNTVRTDGQTVYRHLERHELIGGIGYIQHGLYQGTVDHLGQAVPLQESAATATLAAPGVLDQNGYVIQGRTPGLNVVYVPNVAPMTSKAWDRVPEAGGLGGSDFDGNEGLFDTLDEVHASWLRDIRLAKARVLVARYMLDDLGPGNGANFNMDQEVFSPLKMAPGETVDAPITPIQFAIRFAEHQATADHWTNLAVRAAGYSEQTFGETGDVAVTATESNNRENRSVLTRNRKVRAWRPRLAMLVEKLLTVDAVQFGRPHNPADLNIAFPPGHEDTPLNRAQTAAALRTAQAASTETLVQLQHPEWNPEQVAEEARKIGTEAPAADPFAIGASGGGGQV